MGWDREAPFMTCGEWEDKYQPEIERLRALNAELEDRWDDISYELIAQKRLNAKLVAALLRIADEADSDDGLTAWDGGDIARAAIAKARGEI